MSIAQAYCYKGFLDIINDENNNFFKKLCFQDSHYKPDIICGFAKEITVFSNWYSRRSDVINKENLESMNRLVDVFQGSLKTSSNVRYQFYELSPMDILKDKFMKNQLCYVPFLLSVFITLTLPSALIMKVNE